MYLTVDSLIEKNKIATGSNYITFRKNNVYSYGLDEIYIEKYLIEIYMDKQLIENKLYQITDQFNESRITPVKFSFILLNKIYPTLR